MVQGGLPFPNSDFSLLAVDKFGASVEKSDRLEIAIQIKSKQIWSIDRDLRVVVASTWYFKIFQVLSIDVNILQAVEMNQANSLEVPNCLYLESSVKDSSFGPVNWKYENMYVPPNWLPTIWDSSFHEHKEKAYIVIDVACSWSTIKEHEVSNKYSMEGHVLRIKSSYW